MSEGKPLLRAVGTGNGSLDHVGSLPQPLLPDLDAIEMVGFYEAPDQYPTWVKKVVGQATSDLVQCPLTILPASREALNDITLDGSRGLTAAEAFVAAHYANRGCKVIRLEHMQTSILSRDNPPDSLAEAREVLRGDLLAAMPMSAYQRFINVSEHLQGHSALNGVSPLHYPLHAYVPDFMLAMDGRRFVFVEVKSQTDALHFRQANWFLNLKPADWHYEIVVTVSRKLTAPIRIPAGLEKRGPAWAAEWQRAEQDTESFREISQRAENFQRHARENPSFGKSPSRAAQMRWIKEHLAKL